MLNRTASNRKLAEGLEMKLIFLKVHYVYMYLHLFFFLSPPIPLLLYSFPFSPLFPILPILSSFGLSLLPSSSFPFLSLQGARTTKKDSGGSRARGHALLVPNRPNCVTILSLGKPTLGPRHSTFWSFCVHNNTWNRKWGRPGWKHLSCEWCQVDTRAKLPK